MVVHVDITGYVEQLRADLQSAAATGDATMVHAAERLAGALDAAVRMVLLESLADAAAEITSSLDGAVVEVRLKGREPQFVVSVTTDTAAAALPPPVPESPDGDDDAPTARITLRLPDALKVRAEAAAGRSRQSLNTWLVEAIRAATDAPLAPRERRGVGQHVSGWAR